MMNTIIMEKFEILQELQKYDKETQSEQMLLEKNDADKLTRHRVVSPSICKIRNICKAQ